MAEQSTEIVTTFAPDNPVAVFQNAEQVDELIAKITQVVDNFVPDLTTEKGRKAIASLSFKVARTKTTLDDAGKSLNEGKRKEIDAVDEYRRSIRAALDALKDRARKPLTDWEEAEAARKARAERVLITIDGTLSAPGETSGEIDASIDALDDLVLDPDEMGDWMELAVSKKASAMETLRTMYARAIKSESDAAELARLRAADQEREAQEFARREEARLAAEAKEAEEAEARAAEQAEAKRLADIKAAEDRAAEDARQQAAREAQAKIDAANAETARLQREADERAEADRRAAADQSARDADRAHRGKVMGAAKAAMIELGATEDVAKKIVLAIVANEIPAVTLRF